MTFIAILLLLIGLLVGWYLGKTYYRSTSKLIPLLLLILVSFIAAWLALRYAQTGLRDIKPSSALWTGFIISSIIAFISLLNNGRGCGDPDCSCASGGVCRIKKKRMQAGSAATASAGTAATTTQYTGKTDDLKVIEGVGPVIEKHLHAHGIYTYEQVADTDPIHLKNILESGGDRLAIHDPETRPLQAAYARDGDLSGLAKYQETLKAGRS